MALICAFCLATEQAAQGYTLEPVVTGSDVELLAKYADEDARLVRGPTISVVQGKYQFAVLRPRIVVVPEFTHQSKHKVLRHEA